MLIQKSVILSVYLKEVGCSLAALVLQNNTGTNFSDFFFFFAKNFDLLDHLDMRKSKNLL